MMILVSELSPVVLLLAAIAATTILLLLLLLATCLPPLIKNLDKKSRNRYYTLLAMRRSKEEGRPYTAQVKSGNISNNVCLSSSNDPSTPHNQKKVRSRLCRQYFSSLQWRTKVTHNKQRCVSGFSPPSSKEKRPPVDPVHSSGSLLLCPVVASPGL